MKRYPNLKKLKFYHKKMSPYFWGKNVTPND